MKYKLQRVKMTKENELIVRENVTTNVIGSAGNNQYVIGNEGNNQHVIASAAKQPSLRARRSQSRNKNRVFAGILDCFVAALLAMTCFCRTSRVRTFHFQFSIFNFQFKKGVADSPVNGGIIF
jgi:hypothetical protein